MGIFYPPKLPAGKQLSFYAQHFSTVEAIIQEIAWLKYRIFKELLSCDEKHSCQSDRCV
ncbi:hypothetical protein ACE1CI_17270 [Aerosakkonemataceae cyanobacterium BLCC-F50]|uniref:Uncharacterized protein n=1 Tax=Floridaenema flaviceps BLCC-F50 TaxID=3153642 RepID=A0ABV4XSL8_9CYAN